MATHMGQEPINHIMLVNDKVKNPADAVCTGQSFADQALFRVFATGKIAEKPYVVPTEHQLVVTDVEWYVKLNSTKTGVRTIHLTISIGNVTVFVSRAVVFDFGNKGLPGSSEQLTSGFLVAPGVPICPRVSQLGGPAGVGAPDVDPLTLTMLVLRGYLVAVEGHGKRGGARRVARQNKR